MYWDPFDELDRMHEEMDRLFRRSFYTSETPLLEHSGKNAVAEKSMRTPVCHMHETEGSIIASFELPGVSKDDIELNLNDDSLELKVETKKEEKKNGNDNKSYSFSRQSFYRRIAFPQEIDAGKASAEYKNGILRLELPKKEQLENKSRRLQIK